MKVSAVTIASLGALLISLPVVADDDPPALNPFARPNQKRDDAFLGCVELSDGSLFPGKVFLTRETRLRIYDEQLQRQREVPLRVVRDIVCTIEKEWMEREWRFKENANDVKIFTGREYPARQYRHEITLQDDRKIRGAISGIVYVTPYDNSNAKPAKFLLHKRDKGKVGSQLDSLVYLKRVTLGEAAMRAGQVRKTRESQGRNSRQPPRSLPVDRR